MNNNAKEHMKENKNLYISLGVLLLVLVGGAIGYLNGYRFTDNLRVGKVGDVSLSIPLSGTSVFIDEKDPIVTSADNEVVTTSLSPSTHSVIVSRTGYFPWTKEFKVESKKTRELRPIFIPINTSGEIITNRDPEYAQIRRGIIASTLPTRAKPITLDGVSLWVEDNALTASTTEKIYTVLQPDSLIRNVSFYKTRNDAVIFSIQNGVYVLEIAEGEKRNFMPIYKGQLPSFVPVDENSIYILDGVSLMEVVI